MSNQTTPFEKTQHLIEPHDLVSRQHAIPYDVRRFAGEQQLTFAGKRGRGRRNVPTLSDIYHALTIEGLAFVDATTDASLSFIEIGQPDSCTMARIKFNLETDRRLRVLKNRADNGEFDVIPTTPDGRQVTQISLISLAVNLMRIAIAKREHESSIDNDPNPNKEPGVPRNKRTQRVSNNDPASAM